LLFPECFLQGYLVESEHLSRYALDLTTTSFQKILDRLSPIRPTLVFGVIEQCGAAYSTLRRGEARCAGRLYRKTHLVPGERRFQLETRIDLQPEWRHLRHQHLLRHELSEAAKRGGAGRQSCSCHRRT
jgi:predicted amidohydrolase